MNHAERERNKNHGKRKGENTMQCYDELVARGLIAQVTNEEEIREMVNNGIMYEIFGKYRAPLDEYEVPKLYFVFLYFRIKCSFCAVYPSILCDPVCSF